MWGKDSKKVLDASMTSPGEVVLWEENGQDNQLWYWDGPGNTLFKQLINKVINQMILLNLE